MKKLFLSLLLLLSTLAVGQTHTFPALDTVNNFTNTNTFGSLNGTYIVDGFLYPTIQSAFTAACIFGGGTVYVPAGQYTQSAQFTTCSYLKVIMAGRGQADAANCPVTVTSTLLASNLFDFTNQTDVYMSDFCVKTTVINTGTAFHLSATQRTNLERVYVSGPFTRCIDLVSSSTANSSTIWNGTKDFFCTGMAAGGFGLVLDSGNATTKVINNNNFKQSAFQGGTGGIGVWITNSIQSSVPQVINENEINCSECTAAGAAGVGIQIDKGSTRGITFDSVNAEGSGKCAVLGDNNTVTFIGGNLSSCSVSNVTVTQPSFTQFLGTNVGGTVQQLGITPAGGIYADGLGVGGGAPSTNSINGSTGMAVKISGNPVITVNASSVVFAQQIQLPAALPINQGGTATTSTLAGLVRGGNPFTASELSGDATTSASNVVTVAKVNGVAYGTSPSTNTVPVVTSSNVVTYEALPNAALATMAANTVKANVTSGTATPTDFAMPSCPDSAGNHINYVSGTGFVCGSATETPTAHALLSATHSDTTPHAVVRGDIIAGIGASPTWTAVAKGGTNTYPKWNSSGDVLASTLAASGVGACSSNQFVTGTNADAVPTCNQPAFTNLTGTATAAQIPLPTASTIGGVFSKAAVSHQVLLSISSVDGSVGQGQLTSADISGLINNRSVYYTGCNGTALTGPATVTLPWIGSAVMTCLNTGSTIQIPATSTGTGKNLRVRCSSGGINASSGVFTLVDNGGNTSLTCTTGTGTTCSDTTHGPTVTAGDLLLVQFTTQIGETLANCAASFEIQ